MDRKPFYCREWAFQKLSHCLDQRPASKTCGALLLGGSGCGKTTFCTEICNPSPTQAARQQRALNRRLLCHHFLEAHNEKSLSLSEFLRSLVTQILNHTTESHREKSKLLNKTNDEDLDVEVKTPRTQIADAYLDKLKSDTEIQMALRAKNIEQNPDDCLKRALLFPLLEIEPPKTALFILIDSIDEFSFNYSNSTLTRSRQHEDLNQGRSHHHPHHQQQSKTIAELLANHHHLFPQWLLLVCTARKQSKSIAKMFTGFRKLSLDDLRKSQVVRDVQQYILARLDREQSLRQHISRDTAEMLNQLHIKSNGCFLYLEKVLDGVSDNFIALREVREIPGTLNGLYLWLCQRLFNRRQFAKVRPLLNVVLAARSRLNEVTLYDAIHFRDARLTREAFRKRLHLLRRVIGRNTDVDSQITLFHHSFAEWLLDVKHCTQKYLCDIFDGHATLAGYYTLHAKFLNNREIYDYAFHLTRVAQYLNDKKEKLEKQQQLKSTTTKLENSNETTTTVDQPIYAEINKKKTQDEVVVDCVNEQQQDDQKWLDVNTTIKLWLIFSGCNVEECLLEGNEMAGVNFGAFLPTDQKVLRLLLECGAVEQSDVEDVADVEELDVVESGAMDYRSQISLASTSSEISPEPFYNGQECHGQQALHIAAKLGQVEIVKMLLDSGANIDEPDLDGWTPLRAAAWGGHTEVVELLLSRGCALDSVDAENRTALRAASWSGHDDVVAALLRRGARVDAVDHEGRTALIAAAYMGHVDIVERLLDAGADVDHADADGRTALSVAALCAPRPLDTGGGVGGGAMGGGQNGVVATLLDRGAKVDHVDKEGMTPLLVASFEGHRDVCEILLENEADVDHTDHSGRSPLWAAASMGHAPVVALLLFWGCCIDSMDSEGRTVLSVAAAQGCVEVVRQLLDRGLDEQHRDNSGWTPLHYAAFEGHRDVCETLLEAGARVDETDNEGKAALVLAAQGGHASLVELLVGGGGTGGESGSGDGEGPGGGGSNGSGGKYAAPVDQRPHDGKTALRLAALEGHYDVVEILLENGAQIDAKDADGRSTLYVLALDDRLAMAKFFLRRGADVETRDLEGRTPLHVSAWQGHTDMVQLLLRYGRAHVDARDHENRTALHSACWQGHGAIVRLLLEHGAAPDHTCNQGATALGIAAQEGHEACVVALLEHGADPEHSDACGRNALRVAAKSGHRDVVKLLEEYTAPVGAGATTKASSSATSLASASTTETKPSSAVLYPPTAIGAVGVATPTNNPGIGAEWPDQQRRSMISLGNHSSNSKSSSNLTNSSHSSRKGGAEISKKKENNFSIQPMTFTQQLQRCTRATTRSSAHNKYGSQPQSPIYASPPISPTTLTNEGGSLNIYQPVERRAPPTSFHAHSFLYNSREGEDVEEEDEEEEWVGGGAPAPAPDTHFARDTHMRIILGQDHSMLGIGGGFAGGGAGGVFGGGANKKSFFSSSGGDKEKENGAATKNTKSQKSKRNGIVTNPALRLVANVKNGLDNAAANLRKSASGVASAAQKYENPAQKTNSFHWRKETPL